MAGPMNQSGVAGIVKEAMMGKKKKPDDDLPKKPMAGRFASTKTKATGWKGKK